MLFRSRIDKRRAHEHHRKHQVTSQKHQRQVKAASGNPGGRKLTVLDIPDMEGSDMPKPDEILSAPQKDGTTLKAAEIYEAVWKWLGFLSRHPTTGKPSTSPFINIGINYMNQATRQ